MSEKYAFCVTLRTQLDCCCRGEAEVLILNFKTTWSEFQKASQNATKRGNAKLRIFNFKTTWSEFQRPSQPTTEQGRVKVCLFNSKTTWKGNGMLLGATVLGF